MNITDEDFFWVLLESKLPTHTLLDGYDPQTGRVPQWDELPWEQKYDPVILQSFVTSENRIRLSIAKSIVQIIPCDQNDATLLDYCNYLLRLLWIRENWLMPKKTASYRTSIKENGERSSSYETKNEYTDIDRAKVIPLLCNALLFFCGIDAAPDFPKKVIDLLAERKYIFYETKFWPYSGRKEFCSLTPTGTRVAERSNFRLLQLTGTISLSSPLAESASRDYGVTPIHASAASGKGNRPTIPTEIYGEPAIVEPAEEPAGFYIQNDQEKVLENAVFKGALKAQFVSQNLSEKERNVLLHETLGIGPTEIVKRDGMPESGPNDEAIIFRSEVERVKKQIQRSK